LGRSNSAQRITDPDSVFDLWWAAFWQQCRADSCGNIVVHPFVSGRTLRIEVMHRLITRLQTPRRVVRNLRGSCPALPDEFPVGAGRLSHAVETGPHDRRRAQPGGSRSALAGD
jgi:hypothetical protein